METRVAICSRCVFTAMTTIVMMIVAMIANEINQYTIAALCIPHVSAHTYIQTHAHS